MPDVQFANLGSIWTAQPLSDAAWDWIEENIGDDAPWYGGALAVDHRCGADIVEGMRADGLVVNG